MIENSDIYAKIDYVDGEIEVAKVCEICKRVIRLRERTLDLAELFNDIDITCVICGHYNHGFVYDYLDPYMIDVIDALTKKGYITEYSCQGHRYSKEKYSVPYIHFGNHIEYKEYIEKDLPDSWYIDNDFLNRGSLVIYDNNYEDADYNNRKRILLKWIDTLPVIKEEA